MEEQNNAIIGFYIMGIRKRPELANKPCAVSYSESNRCLTLSITVNDAVENISFEIGRIVQVRNVVRTIMSQPEFQNTSVNQYNVQLLATAVAGASGVLIGSLINQSGLLNSSNSGAVNYTSLNEIHITYMNDENEQRDLIVQTDLDPTNFIDYLQQQILTK